MRFMDQFISEFERDCAAAQMAPEAVVVRAGLHRSTWFRWKKGKVSPTLRALDRARRALDEMRDATA